MSEHDTGTLYKKTKTGKIQQWRAWVEEHEEIEGAYVLKVESGQTEGQKTTTAGQVITEGKQKRTCKQQAIFEATSKVNKKLDEGYFPTIEEAETNIVIRPMLALAFEKRKHNIKWPAIVQRKFDGVRCLVRITPDGVTLESRKGKLFPHMNHIREEAKVRLEAYAKLTPVKSTPSEIILDGELYSDTLGFQELVGLVRREKIKEGDNEKRLQVNLRVYDCVILDDLDATFTTRYNAITSIVGESSILSIVENIEVKDEVDVIIKQAQFVSEGYEGAMVRNKDGKYGLGKRSSDLQKVKSFLDGEYEIIGFEEGSGNDAGTVIWQCRTAPTSDYPYGNDFMVRPRGTREQRREWYENGTQYIGRMLTVRYQELTDDGIPRFPVGVAIRDYE